MTTLDVSNYFLNHIKTARFVVTLIVIGKWKLVDGLPIYPKKILRCTNKAYKAGRKDTKARKARRHVRLERA